ncbi:potassium transporter Kup [Rudaeicoccus suwonensis]|uniref:Probable potassium transport system protein Kup n=1 Tax=Rudaeicoccus suwonensis TaxID=657409 RepID=A0A561E7T0_9MICO|nr:potassium transporter Kup [Rudaeicoccus suwonensis]TWE11675.1 KUP system potassium uptake protein [Rudaeicoccus suwonensis]
MSNEATTGHKRAGMMTLAVGALGVVFGDIGTSPLYALQTVFSIDHNHVHASPSDVYGVISLVFWSITVVVSVKYVLFILRADNDGEGGVMALAHLTRQVVRPGGRRFVVVMILGVLGASLFYGDSVITPAISVMSAIEGLEVPAPSLSHWVVPLGAIIIAGLFLVQRFGTALVGKFFGPVMIVWFLVIGLLGVAKIVPHPAILKSLLPTYAVQFVVDRPIVAFIAMGAVVLAITGAEALYADMGHFGKAPIRRAWFGLVFPCLSLNYLGQGALILDKPSAISNPFFIMAPDWAQIPLVVLATVATVIASQAVISGAYSVSRQAERLGYLPKLTVRHTSESEGGQIYVPAVNWVLFAGVMLLLLVFRSSDRLATAYGLAVTGTFLLTSTLFLVYAESAWHWARWKLILVGVIFFSFEITYFLANMTKVVHGGWLPMLIAICVATSMLTWRRGSQIVTERRTAKEGPLSDFVDWLHTAPVTRVPGTSVYMHPYTRTVPLALRENVLFNHVIHEDVFIVSAVSHNVPHVPDEDRVEVEVLGDPYDAITALKLNFGFQDDQDVPRALRLAADQGVNIDPDEVYYFLSRITVHRDRDKIMPHWRKRLFLAMAHNAANPAEYYRLPEPRTIVMGAQVKF